MKLARTIGDRIWRWYATDGCWHDETGTHRIVPLDQQAPGLRCVLYSHRRTKNERIGEYATFGRAALQVEKKRWRQ